MIKISQKISVIIPAFNEEKNLPRVLKVLEKIKWIDEIIVVDDCSEDKTASVAEGFGIKVISHKKNSGKGGAMATGAKAAKHELLLFLDADLTGLQEDHILKILAPICFTHEADLSLGVFGLEELKSTNLMNMAFPSISGQRAIFKSKLPSLEIIAKQRYGVDYFITKSIPKNRRAVITLPNLSQVIKEDKSENLVKGIQSRVKMYQEILKTMNSMKKDGK